MTPRSDCRRAASVQKRSGTGLFALILLPVAFLGPQGPRTDEGGAAPQLGSVGLSRQMRSAEVGLRADSSWAYFGQSRPGRTPQIFAEGVVSKPEGIYGTIVFSPDLSEAVWAQEGDPWLLSSRWDGEAWTAPEPLQLLDGYSLSHPFYSGDGGRLYFMAGPVESNGEKDDIWVATRAGRGWGDPERLDPTISAVPKHWQFSLDAEGTLYFMGGGRGPDILRAQLRDGHYAEPQRLSGPINTAGPESGPNISPNGDFILFDRWFQSPPLIRIMVSFRNAEGEWGEPVDMSEILGTEDADSCARLSPDGRYLFFQSVRKGSSRHRSIYWVDATVIESLRPAGAR
jgi:hypothetical protein